MSTTTYLFDEQKISFVFEIDPALSSLQFNAAAYRHIFLMYKEALNNTLKYASCTHVRVSAFCQSGFAVFEVRDDGVGFDVATVKEGNGLRNLKNRASSLNGVIEIASALGEGVVIRWSTPLP